MNWRVSISGTWPRVSIKWGPPPICTTQQLTFAPLIPLMLLCMLVGLEKPDTPSVSSTRPLSAQRGSSWSARLPAFTIVSKPVSPTNLAWASKEACWSKKVGDCSESRNLADLFRRIYQHTISWKCIIKELTVLSRWSSNDLALAEAVSAKRVHVFYANNTHAQNTITTRDFPALN